MSTSDRTFKIGLWPTLATLAGLALLLALGTWQFRRYLVKKERERVRAERRDAPPVRIDSLEALRRRGENYRTVELRGRLDPSTRIVVQHRTYNGDPGSWLVQPFHFERGDGVILVNRGWIPFQRAKEELDAYASPPKERPLVALLHRLPTVIADDDRRRALREGSIRLEGARTEWDSFDVRAIYDHISSPTPDEPFVAILAPKHSGDRYPIASNEHVTDPYLTSTRHLSYAIFWFTVALALVGIYIAAGFGVLESRRRGRARSAGGD